MTKQIKLRTHEGTLTFTSEQAREYIEDYGQSEDRERRAIAMDLEDALGPVSARSQSE